MLTDMKKNVARGVLALGLCLFPANLYASSHCQPGEVDFLSARMGRLDDDTQQVSGQKILSLCADRKTGMRRLDYRFGLPGKVEMSFSAPVQGLFSYETQQPSHRASIEALTFRRGAITYAITQCFGMHCGIHDIGLKVYSGAKLLLSLDNDRDQSGGLLVETMDGFASLPPAVKQNRASGLDLFQ